MDEFTLFFFNKSISLNFECFALYFLFIKFLIDLLNMIINLVFLHFINEFLEGFLDSFAFLHVLYFITIDHKLHLDPFDCVVL